MKGAKNLHASRASYIPSSCRSPGTDGERIGQYRALWKVLTASTLARRKTSFSVWYDRTDRNPGGLTISTTGFSAAYGIGGRFELGATLEANRRVVVGRQDELSFGQQALGLFGNQTPGSAAVA
jgi:hypothetical protein